MQSRAQSVLPTGGTVTAGSARIGTDGSTMTVDQASGRAVIDWRSFSIGPGSAVVFRQPDGSSAVLNRVTGTTPSAIAGSLSGNGQIFLINPNGIAVTRSGTVDVGGGFVASTLAMDDADFLAGRIRFSGAGASAGVSNEGTIRAGRGGFAALLGGSISNDGMIEAPLGRIGLGSSERATLDLTGDGFLQIALPSEAIPTAGKALVEAGGILSAPGGRIELKTATAKEIVRDSVHVPGRLEARGISGRDGAIVIEGGAGGRVKLAGTASVASDATVARGGSITVTGREIAVAAAATLDASGAKGGGRVRIGGDREGKGELPRAETLAVAEGAVIRADATDSGRGGDVVLWSDGMTRFAGFVSARGGPSGGDGGQAEVSGKAFLDFAPSGRVDLTAPFGMAGTLLLDPYDLTIGTAAGTGTTQTGTPANAVEAAANSSILNVTTLQTLLASASVVVSTGSSGTQAGNITVAAPITWSSGFSLTLQAAGAITTNTGAAITATGAGAGVTLSAGGAITTNAAISTNGGPVLLSAGTNAALASSISVGSGGPGGATVRANGNVTMSSGSSITTQGGDIVLNADRDGTGGGFITVTSATINSNGGAINFGGGLDPLTGFAVGTTTNSGITVTGTSRVSSGNGAIVMRGTGSTAGGSVFGVVISTSAIVETVDGSILMVGQGGSSHGVNVLAGTTVRATGTGSITLLGTGGAMTAAGAGVHIAGAVAAAGGTIEFIGTGGSAGTQSYGVTLGTAATVSNTGAGAIRMTGTGGGAGTTDSNAGVHFQGGTVTAVDGLVTITGTGGIGTGGYAYGVRLGGTNPILRTTGNGSITITGTGGSVAAPHNYGVYLTAGATVAAAGRGDLTVNGTAGSATTASGHGILIDNAVVSVADGTLRLDGSGNGTGGTASGVMTSGAATVLRSTGSGTISLFGRSAAGSLAGVTGIQISGGSTVSSVGTGRIDFTGRGGTSTASGQYGVYLRTGGTVTSAAGPITIVGDGAAAGSTMAHGIYTVDANTTVSGLGATTVTLIGNGGGTTGNSAGNYGVFVETGSTVSTVDGALTVTAVGGGAGTGGTNHGAWMSGRLLTTGTGTLTLTGTGGNASGTGANNSGIRLIAANAIVTTGGGAVRLTGIGRGSGTTDIALQVANTIALSTGSELLLRGDAMSISGGITGTGSLVIEPRTPGTTIGLGTSVIGQMHFSTTVLNYFPATLASITFGSPIAGTVDVRAWTPAAPAKIISGNAILINGPLTASSGLTLQAAGAITTAGPMTGGGLLFSAGTDVTIGSAVSAGVGASAGIVVRAGDTIALNAGGSLTTQGSPILLHADHDASGAGAIAYNAGTITTNGGAITLVSDRLTLSQDLAGTGALTLRTATAGTSIGIGDGASGTLTLGKALLGRIRPGFASITIGSAAAGPVEVGEWTVPAALNLLSGAGIAVTGALGVSGDLALSAAGPLSLASSVTVQGRLSLAGAGLGLDGASLSATELSMTADMPITLTGMNAFDTGSIWNFGGAIGGTGGLRKLGSGTLVLSADNSYGGPTVVAAGVLRVGEGGTAGSLGTGAVTNDGILVFDRSDDTTVSNAIGGSGELVKSGAGILTLTGDNVRSGITTIAAGTLRIGAGGMTGLIGSGAIVNEGMLVFDRSDAVTIANAVTGTPASRLVVLSGGAVTIAGAIAGGSFSATTPDDVRIAPGGSIAAASPVIAAGGRFLNEAGAGAVTASSGRWLILSRDPDTSVFGDLDSGNAAVWGVARTGFDPSAVGAAGNRYLFAFRPVVTISGATMEKFYGQDVSARAATAFTLSAPHPGVAGAFSADVFTGTPVAFSAGSDERAMPGSYDLTLSTDGFVTPGGYRITATPGRLVVNRAALTVSGITAADKTEDGSVVAEVSTAGLRLEGLMPWDRVTVRSRGEFESSAPGPGKIVRLTNVFEGDLDGYEIVDQTTARADVLLRPSLPTPGADAAPAAQRIRHLAEPKKLDDFGDSTADMVRTLEAALPSALNGGACGASGAGGSAGAPPEGCLSGPSLAGAARN